MIFNTKYEIGQSVWVMRGENESARPKEVQIDSIQIQHGDSSSLEESEQGIFYDFYNDDTLEVDCAAEEEIFTTKQELLDNL